ncbi:helix-turn-helix transcriptional regulator, partial [Streptosporangium canum]|uniref:helix-turn-helix domain-containing protein n=1 Tax=Streptosporangium canum TaxID=324952 RepID=UPI003423DD00
WDLDRAAQLARLRGVIAPARHRGGPRGYGDTLSPRENEVAKLAATGMTNREIAKELFLSTKTVDKHLSAALRKLGLRSRAALARHLE